MDSVDFCYWLQGLFELQSPKKLNAKQTELIRRHLALVFKHDIDMQYGDQAHQQVLNEIHNPPTLTEPWPFPKPKPGDPVGVPLNPPPLPWEDDMHKPPKDTLYRC